MARRQFTFVFKRECAELVIKQGYKITDAAKAINIGLSTLQRWVSQYKQENIV